MAPNVEIPGLFQNLNVLKSDMKSPGLVPFNEKLNHFGAKS